MKTPEQEVEEYFGEPPTGLEVWFYLAINLLSALLTVGIFALIAWVIVRLLPR